jgi:hypothetical protein
MPGQVIHPALCPVTVEQIQGHFWRPVNEKHGSEITKISEWLRPALEVYEHDVTADPLHPDWDLDKIKRLGTLVASSFSLFWAGLSRGGEPHPGGVIDVLLSRLAGGKGSGTAAY